MQLKSFAAALILAAVASVALADGPETDAKAPQANAAAQPDPNRKICKNEKPMGSLIPARVCKTAAQWDEERDAARKAMQDLQQRTGSTSGR